jgi:hypothetical protein
MAGYMRDYFCLLELVDNYWVFSSMKLSDMWRNPIKLKLTLKVLA